MRQGLHINKFGIKNWYVNDKCHREDGPAVEWPNGDKKWYLNGKIVFSKHVNFLHKYHNLSESFKRSIIKYQLTL
jgi:hypothetical protein